MKNMHDFELVRKRKNFDGAKMKKQLKDPKEKILFDVLLMVYIRIDDSELWSGY